MVELCHRGYTQEEIAGLLGITQQAVSKHVRSAVRNRPHLNVQRKSRPKVVAFSQLRGREFRIDSI